MQSHTNFVSAEITNKNFRSSKTDGDSLHNRVAKFVLDIQSDVSLEELLGAGDQNRNNNNKQQRPYGDIRLNDEQCRALKQLYNEIQERQQGLINTRQAGSAKRASSENNYYNGRSKLPRHMDCLLQDTADNVDETWLLNLAEQLGLDKNTDLPELNSDLVTELT